MNNKAEFNAVEAKLIDIFEAFGGSEVGAFYISFSTDCETFGTKAELMQAITDTLNEWFKEDGIIDLITDRPTFDSVGDYLPLFLALPNNTTVLAVGNGYVSAPTDITAYLHTDYNNSKVLAIYDHETNEEETRQTLEELFPSRLINDYVVTLGTKSGFGSQTPYNIVVGAENEAEAITKAMQHLNDNSDVPMNDFVNIRVQTTAEARAEREAEEKAKVYTCDVCDSIYTGGGIWCTVYQCSGADSDIYYAIDNTFDEFDGMAQYSHKADRINGSDDEFGFMEPTRNITVGEMSEDEKIIWFKLKLKEAETLRNEY